MEGVGFIPLWGSIIHSWAGSAHFREAPLDSKSQVEDPKDPKPASVCLPTGEHGMSGVRYAPEPLIGGF